MPADRAIAMGDRQRYHLAQCADVAVLDAPCMPLYWRATAADFVLFFRKPVSSTISTASRFGQRLEHCTLDRGRAPPPRPTARARAPVACATAGRRQYARPVA